MKYLSLTLFFLFSITSVQAKFITGVGYLKPGEYRVDNEISSVPFGFNAVPMIAYQGERLRVYGPNISYALLKGMIGFSANIKALGDRYVAHELDQRETAVNAGATLRLLFLRISHTSDVSNVYNGNTTHVTLGRPFMLSESFILRASFTKEYLNDSYVNYYFGVTEDEVGFFDEYSTQSAANDVYNAALTFRASEINSYTLNFTHRKFDQVIIDSPTVNTSSYNSWSFFWSHAL